MNNDNFNVTDYLDTPEDVKNYLQAALEENDLDYFIDALGIVSKAKGMKQIAEQTGLGYQSLYKSFSKGKHPRFETVYKVINALGLQLKLVA